MLDRDYLCLRRVRLNPGQEWVSSASGLHFLLPKEGALEWLFGKGSQPCRPGDVLVFQAPPGGKVRSSGPEGLGFLWFSVFVEHLFPLFATDELHLVQPVLEAFKTSRLYPADSPVAVECHKLIAGLTPQANLDHRSQLVRIAGFTLSLELNRPHFRRNFASGIPEDDGLIQGLEKLSVTDLLDSNVSDLARRFNFSRRHLSRLFHERFGLSIAALRMEMRLLKAACLLREQSAKVITVAEQCGFNHLGLFNTCFKRRFGASPGQWRKTLIQVEPSRPNVNDLDPACHMLANGLCPWAGKSNRYLPAPLRPDPVSAAAPPTPARAPIRPDPPSRNRRKSSAAFTTGNGDSLSTQAPSMLAIALAP